MIFSYISYMRDYCLKLKVKINLSDMYHQRDNDKLYYYHIFKNFPLQILISYAFQYTRTNLINLRNKPGAAQYQ